MKRAVSSSSRQVPSQQPVSCSLCRTRKLKCDRNQPCFNCSSRQMDCVYSNNRRNGGSSTSTTEDCDRFLS
ncbi:hypothetical protein ASPZODRAFT_123415 [Penicilliopsis zonata CBS 506.65]|uniref:Zn(2)-C6 fungal-type domain-containing protein n=1 Tax=Penicilliopsis zonata CBS 506.65 TaxID=1073090 RepID=A0A1L9S954_9EURO|nr:hypothetical protein ASPZODRAFT_123415 [Penicilliopsis zonata CBS 506.65]OJJ43686.1 hypothetical protein ASPZODRAFT_123415 [Penicilliopsis zonata CBS 506.65]